MKEYRMSQPKLFEKLIQVFGSISAISGKKILVIRDLEVALMLSVRNSVVYITDDEECAEAFRKNTEAGMGDDDKVFFINNYKTELKELLTDMHFDVAIQNPPYDRNLHLKILAEVLNHADKVINISPVRWLQDPFAPYSTRSDYCKFENSVSKHIKDLEVIPAKNASQIFQEAAFIMNLGIYICDSEGGYVYQHNDILINKIVNKTLENNWTKFGWKNYYSGLIPVKKYSLNVAGVHSVDATYPLMNKTYSDQCIVKPLARSSVAHDGNFGGGHFEFMTDIERLNFYNCYNSDFMIWFCKKWKVDIRIINYKVPYFDDYTHPWKLKDFFAWFELTKEEQARVVKEIRAMRHTKIH